MPDPVRTRTIGVKVADGTEGEYVILRNLDTGAKLTNKLNSKKEVVFKAPITNWRNGDKIQVEIEGSVAGTEQKKLQSGGVKFDLSASADTSTPGVSL